MKNKITDTMRIDFLEKGKYSGGALINDDNGHWTFDDGGFQPVPIKKGPIAMTMTFFVEKKKWKNSIREAIDSKIKEKE